MAVSPLISKIVNRTLVVNKCGRCTNRTANRTGFCYLHEDDALAEFRATASSGDLGEEAMLVLENGCTPLTDPEDHAIEDRRTLSRYSRMLEADLANAIHVKHPIFLYGPPGVGKSAMIENLASLYGAQLEVIIGGQMAPTDIAGLPYSLGNTDQGERGGTAVDTPEWGRRLISECKGGRPGILFFDELTNTDRQTQAAMLRLINERVFPNGDRLPDSVAIIAAGNIGDHAMVGEGLGPAMRNRFSIRECHPPVQDFREGLATAWGREVSDSEKQARLLVAAFLHKFPDCAYDEGALTSDDDTQAFATYRSWDKLAHVMGQGQFISSEHLRSTLGAYVGISTGEAFWDYLQGLDLPDPHEVVKDPTIVDWNEIGSDEAFAIMLSVRQGSVIERDPIGVIRLYTHVAGTKSQQYAASTLGGMTVHVRDAWLRKGGHSIRDSEAYRKDPTYPEYRKSFLEFSRSYADILDAAGLSSLHP